MPGSYRSAIFAGFHLLLGLTAMVLAVLGFTQANTNRALQKAVASNQARLERAGTFANLDNSLVQLIAKSAADNKDAALTTLLANNGITFHVAPTAQTDSGAKP